MEHELIPPRYLPQTDSDMSNDGSDAATILGSDTASGVTTLSGSGQLAMPSSVQSRSVSPIMKITAKKHEIIDGARWAFDITLVEQTDGTANPASVNGVVANYIAIMTARHFDTAQFTDDEWIDQFRATYRPKGGNVWTVNICAVFKPLFPKCLPADIFVMDPENSASKFKGAYRGETVIAPFHPTANDSRWMHLFVPVTCLASRPEIRTAMQGKLEEAGLRLKEEDKDFKLIKPDLGKWHVNFEVRNVDPVAENLYKLAQLEINGIGMRTYISPQFMEHGLPQNCPRCYTWLRWNTCFCPDKKVKKDGYQRALDGVNAARRKRRIEAATSSDAAF